ncbi:MAG TPA: response regulator transcription factor [Anaerolineae bacterium]
MGIRVLLADDHPLFRDGVAALLRTRGFDVVGEAGDGVEALEMARQLHPDMILMDIQMPRLDGLMATRLITTETPETHVIMLTVSEEDENLFEAIKSGAQGYLLKNTDTQTFFELLTGVSRGEAPMSRQLAGKILREFARKITGDKQPDERNGELSDREKDVLRLVAEGMTNRDIGGRLNLSENTIKYHLKNIMQKLHLKNRAQAVAFALQSGMLKEKK